MSLGGWSIGPSLLYVGFAGLLYWLGGLGRRRRADDGVRTAAFVAGLVTIVVALDSPIDRYAEQLFWVHMLQHVLLLTVAPPLILLGRPWPRMWRGLPLRLANERRARRSPGVELALHCDRWRDRFLRGCSST